jgi:ketosteroid isomerase-like protein
VSEANVELVRRIYRDGLLGDPDGLVALTADDVEYVNPPEAVDPGTRRGRAGFRSALQNLADHFVSSRNELLELFDVGERVVASVVFHARMRDSDTEVSQPEAHTWTLRDGRIARLEWGLDLDAALNVAKLLDGFSRYSAGERDFIADLYAADVEWRDLDHAPDVPELTQGIDALRALADQWDAAFDDFRAEVLECVDVGDSVLCVTCWRGEGKGSGMTTELHRAEIYEFEDGRIARVTVYPDRAAAFAAAGLPEQE